MDECVQEEDTYPWEVGVDHAPGENVEACQDMEVAGVVGKAHHVDTCLLQGGCGGGVAFCSAGASGVDKNGGLGDGEGVAFDGVAHLPNAALMKESILALKLCLLLS